MCFGVDPLTPRPVQTSPESPRGSGRGSRKRGAGGWGPTVGGRGVGGDTRRQTSGAPTSTLRKRRQKPPTLPPFRVLDRNGLQRCTTLLGQLFHMMENGDWRLKMNPVDGVAGQSKKVVWCREESRERPPQRLSETHQVPEGDTDPRGRREEGRVPETTSVRTDGQRCP